MTGLIIKDFLFMKAQAKALSFLFIFFGILSFVSQSTSYIVIMCSMLAIPACASLAGYDDSVKWSRFACSLPYTRAQIVASRYISVVILTFAVAVVAFCFCIIQILTFKNTNIEETMFMLVGSLSIAILSLSLVMPLFTKLGVEKARILMMISLVFPTILIMIVDSADVIGLLNSISQIPTWLIMLTLVIFVALCLYISYLISLKIFSKKDL